MVECRVAKMAGMGGDKQMGAEAEAIVEDY